MTAPSEPPRTSDGREAACVARWPGCESGLYDPRCCRFPKSCSAGVREPPRTWHEAVHEAEHGGICWGQGGTKQAQCEDPAHYAPVAPPRAEADEAEVGVELWALEDGDPNERIAYTNEPYARQDVKVNGLTGHLVRYVSERHHLAAVAEAVEAEFHRVSALPHHVAAGESVHCQECIAAVAKARAEREEECERLGHDRIGAWPATKARIEADRDEWKRRAEAAEARGPNEECRGCRLGYPDLRDHAGWCSLRLAQPAAGQKTSEDALGAACTSRRAEAPKSPGLTSVEAPEGKLVPDPGMQEHRGRGASAVAGEGAKIDPSRSPGKDTAPQRDPDCGTSSATSNATQEGKDVEDGEDSEGDGRGGDGRDARGPEVHGDARAERSSRPAAGEHGDRVSVRPDVGGRGGVSTVSAGGRIAPAVDPAPQGSPAPGVPGGDDREARRRAAYPDVYVVLSSVDGYGLMAGTPLCVDLSEASARYRKIGDCVRYVPADRAEARVRELEETCVALRAESAQRWADLVMVTAERDEASILAQARLQSLYEQSLRLSEAHERVDAARRDGWERGAEAERARIEEHCHFEVEELDSAPYAPAPSPPAALVAEETLPLYGVWCEPTRLNRAPEAKASFLARDPMTLDAARALAEMYNGDFEGAWVATPRALPTPRAPEGK